MYNSSQEFPIIITHLNSIKFSNNWKNYSIFSFEISRSFCTKFYSIVEELKVFLKCKVFQRCYIYICLYIILYIGATSGLQNKDCMILKSLAYDVIFLSGKRIYMQYIKVLTICSSSATHLWILNICISIHSILHYRGWNIVWSRNRFSIPVNRVENRIFYPR